MDRSTQLKMVICGVALVTLSTVRPSSAQVVGGGCGFGSGGGDFASLASSVIEGDTACVHFGTGPQSLRVDFAGDHSFKVIANVLKEFFLEIVSTSISPPGPTSRYPEPTSEICIPYVFATSTTPGSCALYTVSAFDGDTHDPIPPEDEDQYFSGKIIYRIAWDFPLLTTTYGTITYDNPRALRADNEVSPFFDLTDGVFPTLVSGQDPGVDESADGFSQHIVVQQSHGTGLAGCFAPLNCSAPNNPAANVFNAGQTIPVKVALNPSNPAADLRLTYTDPGGLPHLAQASGRSNIANMFRATGGRFEFNWSTKGLAPGDYLLTIAPGTNSGGLFAPTTIMVRLR